VGHAWTESLFPFSSPLIGTVAFVALCALLWRAATRESHD
jgi:hypothetical protein